eukprot:362563-Chlamydomonas_euryale.AAC.9
MAGKGIGGGGWRGSGAWQSGCEWHEQLHDRMHLTAWTQCLTAAKRGICRRKETHMRLRIGTRNDAPSRGAPPSTPASAHILSATPAERAHEGMAGVHSLPRLNL